MQKPLRRTIYVSPSDQDAIVRLVATEAAHDLKAKHESVYLDQVHGIIDTVLNRVASRQFPNTIMGTINQYRQFSAINAPPNDKYAVYGSVDRVPDRVIPSYLPGIVDDWISARINGTPSSVGGNLNYANPSHSDKPNLAWINALNGPRYGIGDETHYHGTVAGKTPVEAVLSPKPLLTGGTSPTERHEAMQAALVRGELVWANDAIIPKPSHYDLQGQPAFANPPILTAPASPASNWPDITVDDPQQFKRAPGQLGYPDPLPGADTALNAIQGLAPGGVGARPSSALGYANGGPLQGWNPGFPPAQPSPSITGSYASPPAGLPDANPAMGRNYGAPASSHVRNYFPGADLSSIGWSGPQTVSAGPGNPAPLSDFERQMAQVPSMVIPKYVAVTHHVPNPAYVAQFGPVEPPMPDFMSMLAARLSPDRGTSVDPAFAGQAPGPFGASAPPPMSDYLLDKTPPPLPSFTAPPLPTIQDPEAIRAILVPALQALQK